MWGNIRNALIFGLCIVFTVVECLVRPVEERTFEGDIDMSREEMNGMQMEILFTGKVHAVKVWPGGAIPYVISKKIDRKYKKLILGAMRDISGDTCVKFVPRRKSDISFVEFVMDKPNKCSSKLGWVGKLQRILLGRNCMRYGIIVHEILHALGLFHEQSRPDRDHHVRILWDNIKSPEVKRNFEVYGTQFYTDHKTPYDYGSILHYRSDAFTKMKGKKTIVTRTKARIGQRSSMSHFDQDKVNRLYNCPKRG